MKIRIPKNHFKFYRKMYNYLHHTLGVETISQGHLDLSKKMMANYLNNHHLDKGKEFHLLTEENNQEKPPMPPKTPFHAQPPQDVSMTTSNESNSKLDELHQRIYSCQNCFLGQVRKNHVRLPYRSDITQTPIMVIVDIPSFYDQTQGKYFTDDAGQLLKKILHHLEIDINTLYYTGAIKCSSSQEITDKLDQIIACRKHLHEEIQILKPKWILGFGKNTYDFLMSDPTEIQNKDFIDSQDFYQYLGKELSYHGIDIVFTYHPRDLLFDTTLKKETWEHLKVFRHKIKEMIKDARVVSI